MSGGGGAVYRVLVVEDEPLIALMVEEMVLELGHEVLATAHDVRSGLAALETAEPDVALLDVNLGSGETSERLAQLCAARGIPAVFTTGYGTGDLPDICRGHPVLAKPYDMTALGAALRRAMGSGD